LGALGGFLILIAVVLAAFPFLFDHGEPMLITGVPFTGPNATHWFGTDFVGRDLYARTIWGARVSIQVGVTAVFLGITFAMVVAVITTYYGGLWDLIVQRIVDALLAIPGLILALFVLTVIGSSLTTLIGTMAFLFIPRTIRTLRSAVLSVKQMPYVESAKAIGASTPRILIKYIFPQITALYLIIVSLIIGSAIILETSLSFLGLGLPVDTPSWGNLVNEGVGSIFFTGYRQVIPPGIAIAATVFGFNLLGDALRDILDPRLRGSGVGLRGRGGGPAAG
jgi:ABC-type dipeptide/oligopeptide/nickel transport system permease subunit